MMSKYKIHSGERGVALIFALGILALLMIMMVAFVSSMLLQYQSSSNMSRMVDSDLLADSAMNRALGIMNMLVADVKAAPKDTSLVRNFNRVVSLADSNSANYGTSAADDLKITGIYGYAKTTMDEPHWIYVRGNSAGSAPKDTDPIIGRFAFAAVPNFRPKMNFNAIWGLPGYTTGRSGADFREVATDLLTGWSTTKVTEPASTVSSSTFSNIINLADVADYLKSYVDTSLLGTSSEFSDLENNLNKYFTAGVKGQEIYLGTDGTDEKYYQRLNLAQIKERVENVNSNKRVDLFYDAAQGQTDPLSSGASDTTKLNPFLNKFVTADAGTFHTLTDFKKQIIANIIDFAMPADETVTSDIDPSLWSATRIPLYTGNKKTCYINEVGLVLSANVSVSGGVSKTATLTSVKVIPVIEVVDVYGGDKNAGTEATETKEGYYVFLDAKVSGTVQIISQTSSEEAKFSTDTGNGSKWSDGFTILYDTDSQPSGWVNGSMNGYYVGNGSSNINTLDLTASYDTRVSGTHYFELKFTQLKFDINNAYMVHYYSTKDETGAIKYSKDDASIDFANIQKSYTHAAADSIEIAATTTIYRSCFVETDDPRQNLNEGDWTYHNGSQYVSDNPYTAGNVQTIGKINTTATAALTEMGNCYSGTSDLAYDPEDVTDISLGKLSTAYIKEGTFESIWELGAVHRGIAWQTLNLKIANTDANGYNGVGGDYSKGDAEIADFVYVAKSDTNPYPTNFDINARPIGTNAPIPTVIKPPITNDDALLTNYYNGLPWEQMFDKVTVNSASSKYVFDDGTALSDTQIDAILGEIYSSSYKTEPFVRRGDIAEVISTGIAGNDAQKESVFGKVANLIEAKNDFPITTQLVVVAEIINDVGGEGGNSINLKSFADDGKEIDEDCEIGKFEDGFDQVVARRKMLVTVQYRPTASKDRLKVTDIRDIE